MPSTEQLFLIVVMLASLFMASLTYSAGVQSGIAVGKVRVYETLYEKELKCDLGTSFKPLEIE